MFSVLKFELSYRFRRPATYAYFAILFLLCFLFVTTDAITIGGAVGNVNKNSPYTIHQVVMILTLIGALIISAVMGTPVFRDFEHNIHEIIFTTPVSKLQYLGGRFAGSYITALFIFSGIVLGIFTGLYMPWVDKEQIGPFMLKAYTTPFFEFVVPNVFILGVIFFATGTLLRNQLAIYVQGMAFLIIYLVLSSLAGDVETNPAASLLDPFGINSAFYLTRYWTPAEKNILTVPFESYLLWNRLIWLAVALIIATLTYRFFTFSKSASLTKFRKKKFQETNLSTPVGNLNPGPATLLYNNHMKWKQWWHQVRFDFTGVVRSVTFLAIVLCGVFLLLGQIPDAAKMYGTSIYPVTYAIIDDLSSNFFLFILIVITFFSGELVWKERESRINNLTDALPVSGWITMSAKFFSLCLIVAMMQLIVIAIGVLIQTLNGFYRYDFAVYFKYLFVSQYPGMVLLILLAFFIHNLVNNKFLGHTLMIVYFIGRIAASAMGFTHYMIWYGVTPSAPYSDMNGFAHFLYPKFMLLIYWGSLGVILFVSGILISRQGSEINFKTRWKQLQMKWHAGEGKRVILISLIVFLVSGSFIFYNTNILHSYKTDKTLRHLQAEYEKIYKKYLDYNQPRITEVNLHVDLTPEKRYAHITGYYYIKNKSSKPIDTLLVSWSDDEVKINKLNFGILSEEVENFNRHFTIHKLAHPLLPGDSSKVDFDLEYIHRGFANNEEELGLEYNGTFIGKSYLPSFGYSEEAELQDNSDRRKEGLQPKTHTMRLLSDSAAVRNTYLANDADWIKYECVISTSADQIAISPGYLQKEWTSGNRRYFHYKMDAPILNFYSFLSARYAVFKDKYKGVNIEIYYHPTHQWNIQRMNDAIKKTLDYCQQNFSPYQFHQVRIIEFPKYATFAQSFPNTIPFSEAIGFIYHVENEDDIDNAFYVTSHEVAHQWWGHQVTGANTQGSTMMVESMAQYTALMVMEKEYGKAAMQKFLKYELDEYLMGRSGERIAEQPLAFNDGQGYIHYQKGSLVMYAMRDYIGEDSLNTAFRRFIRTYGFQSAPYVQSPEMVKYIKAVTPDSLKNVVDDMFDKITLFDLKCNSVQCEKKGNRYSVTMELEAKKYYADSSGNQKQTRINDWIDVGILKKDEKGKPEYLYLQKHKFTEGKTTVTILVNEAAQEAGIDPLHKLIDRLSEDNTKPVTVKS
ncbi:MAG: ABC transporter permease [Bacteroidetes bacterium]|nr:ABC transporter permease [Bacteroidota bacterium]